MAKTTTTYNERAMLIANALVELIQDHELREHGGERCPRETFNMLAFLAHKLGIQDLGDSNSMRELDRHIRDYQAVHEEHHVHAGASE